METLGDILVTETSKLTSNYYQCKNCDYICFKKYNLDRHYFSRKHKTVTFSKQKGAKNEQNEQKKSINKKCCEKFVCDFCNKEYESRNGLWKHRKTCKTDDGASPETEAMNTVIYNQPTDKDLIMMLIKENSELKTMMMEQQNMMMKVIENGTHTNNTINNIQKYYPNHSPLIKIYNFKTIQLCPKIVIDQHTPLNIIPNIKTILTIHFLG